MKAMVKNMVQVKVYSSGELARMYGVNRRTFKRWIEPFLNRIGKRRGRFYTIMQVKIIFEKLGTPPAPVESK